MPVRFLYAREKGEEQSVRIEVVAKMRKATGAAVPCRCYELNYCTAAATATTHLSVESLLELIMMKAL